MLLRRHTGYLDSVRQHERHGLSVLQELRDGNWLCDFMVKRLYQAPDLIPFLNFMREKIDKIITLPRFTIPKYFDRLIIALDISGREQLVRNMSKFVKNGDDFVHALAFSSVALYGPVRDAPLIHQSLNKIFADTLVERRDCCLAATIYKIICTMLFLNNSECYNIDTIFLIFASMYH